MAVANMAVAIGGYGMKVVPTVAVAIMAVVVLVLVATILVEFLIIPMVGVMHLFTAVAEMMVGKATQAGVRIVTIMAKATQVGRTAVTVPTTVKVMEAIPGRLQQQRRYRSRN